MLIIGSQNYKLKAVTDNTSHEIKDLVLFLDNLKANSEKEPSMDNASTYHKLKVAFDEVFIDIRDNRIDKRSNLLIMAHNMFRKNLNVYYYLLKTIASVETPDLEAIKERLGGVVCRCHQDNSMEKSELSLSEIELLYQILVDNTQITDPLTRKIFHSLQPLMRF